MEASSSNRPKRTANRGNPTTPFSTKSLTGYLSYAPVEEMDKARNRSLAMYCGLNDFYQYISQYFYGCPILGKDHPFFDSLVKAIMHDCMEMENFLYEMGEVLTDKIAEKINILQDKIRNSDKLTSDQKLQWSVVYEGYILTTDDLFTQHCSEERVAALTQSLIPLPLFAMAESIKAVRIS